MAKLIACAGQGVEISGVPTEIKILPLGRVHSQKGDFNVDDESFELIRKQFKDRKLDLVIDYEHQTLSDVQAPAGGWIKDLYKGEDAIIAKVEWTPKAAEYLKNKEYRYLSPVVLVRKRDQKATAIHSVALTNTPAIDGMFALVNSLDIEDISEGGNIMDLKELAKALGLPETATEEEIKKAVEDAVKAAEKLKEMDGKKPGEGDGKPGDGEPKPEGADMVANSTILSMLGLKADAKTEDVAASIMALKAGAPDTQAELLALKYGVYTPLFSNMGEAAALQPDELVFGAMMSGFNEKCYDGLSFFNTAHKVGDATYSNRSNKKLSRESYMEGRSSIMSIKGDKGKSLKLVPDLLVLPPALEETARLILEADQIDGTTNVLKGTAKLHVEPALAEHPEYWFLLCTNRFLKPFIYQLRKKIKFTSLTRDTDENVFMLDEYLYGADGRSNAGYGFWQMAYGSTGEVEAQAQG